MLSTGTTINLHKCIIEDSVTHVGHIIIWKTLVCSCKRTSVFLKGRPYLVYCILNM